MRRRLHGCGFLSGISARISANKYLVNMYRATSTKTADIKHQQKPPTKTWNHVHGERLNFLERKQERRDRRIFRAYISGERKYTMNYALMMEHPSPASPSDVQPQSAGASSTNSSTRDLGNLASRSREYGSSRSATANSASSADRTREFRRVRHFKISRILTNSRVRSVPRSDHGSSYANTRARKE